MYNEDYLLRMFEQMAEMLAQACGFSELVHIVQLNRRGEHAEALAAIDRAWDDLFPGPRGMVQAVDTATLVAMLRQPVRLRVAAQLFAEEARAWAGQGDAARAAACRRRALELILEAGAIDPADEDRAALDELRAAVPLDALSARHRTMLPDQA
jgi:hypothetical protein